MNAASVAGWNFSNGLGRWPVACLTQSSKTRSLISTFAARIHTQHKGPDMTDKFLTVAELLALLAAVSPDAILVIVDGCVTIDLDALKQDNERPLECLG